MCNRSKPLKTIFIFVNEIRNDVCVASNALNTNYMIQKTILALMIGAATLASCSKSNTSTSGSSSVDCSTVTSTFAANVLPLIQTSCNTNSSCHATGSSRGPGALTTYQQIYSNRSSIRSSVSSGSMPQGSSLSSAQKNIILCWIDNGAANN
jgi:hypothetical protein